ncbi:MAG: hypothetical protein HQL25_04330 [Candidatus Omnitrophica bacterium]|nr:hypothetical protein [Candidatus Omnitrophota bacterium]
MFRSKFSIFSRLISLFILIAFLTTSVLPAQAQGVIGLPAVGTMLSPTAAFEPVLIKGVQVHQDNPLLFDFIVDSGKSGMAITSPEFKNESQKLIKYFLASLTIKEENLWVNLSPTEKDRIIPDELGKTEMGRDMLAQDYILKQLTASLLYPEKEIGQKFWDKVYSEVKAKYGTAEIPTDTFNKVWIVADKAKVLERNNTAYVVGAHLKVLTEKDYQSSDWAQKHLPPDQITGVGKGRVGGDNTQILKEIIIPAIEKEVNEGSHFAQLRQMFYSMILASWYKHALKNALLNQVYSNKAKTNGVLSDDPNMKEKIYAQYLESFKKGAYDLIKEEYDPQTQTVVARKYISGGLGVGEILEEKGPQVARNLSLGETISKTGDQAMVEAGVKRTDAAMLVPQSVLTEMQNLKVDSLLKSLKDGIVTLDVLSARLEEIFKTSQRSSILSIENGKTFEADQMLVFGDGESFIFPVSTRKLLFERFPNVFTVTVNIRGSEAKFIIAFSANTIPTDLAMNTLDGESLASVKKMINVIHDAPEEQIIAAFGAIESRVSPQEFTGLKEIVSRFRTSTPAQIDAAMSANASALLMYSGSMAGALIVYGIASKLGVQNEGTLRMIFAVSWAGFVLLFDEISVRLPSRDKAMISDALRSAIRQGILKLDLKPGEIFTYQWVFGAATARDLLEWTGLSDERIYIAEHAGHPGYAIVPGLMRVDFIIPKSVGSISRAALAKIVFGDEKYFYRFRVSDDDQVFVVPSEETEILTYHQAHIGVMTDLKGRRNLDAWLFDNGWRNMSSTGVGGVVTGTGDFYLWENGQRDKAMVSSSRVVPYNITQMTTLMDHFGKAFSSWVSVEPSQRKHMLETLLTGSTGREEGISIGIDFSGTNLHLRLVNLKDGKATILSKEDLNWEKEAVDVDITDEKAVFDVVAQKMESLLNKARKAGVTLPEKIKAGLSFAFPIKQTSLAEGTLLRRTKGWFEKGIQGNVVNVLKQALQRKGVSSVEVNSLLNDTTATLLSAIGSMLGVIIGTGFNICIVMPDGTILNTEAGGIAVSEVFKSQADIDFWNSLVGANQSNPLEKMLTGKGLGELIALQLNKLHEQENIFGSANVDVLKNKGTIAPEFITEVLSSPNPVQAVKKITDRLGVAEITNESVARQIYDVFDNTMARAAQLSAIIIGASLKQADPDGKLLKEIGQYTFVIDGSTYWLSPQYKERVRRHLVELGVVANENQLDIREVDSPTAVGAAVAAHIADAAINKQVDIAMIGNEVADIAAAYFFFNMRGQELIAEVKAQNYFVRASNIEIFEEKPVPGKYLLDLFIDQDGHVKSQQAVAVSPIKYILKELDIGNAKSEFRNALNRSWDFFKIRIDGKIYFAVKTASVDPIIFQLDKAMLGVDENYPLRERVVSFDQVFERATARAINIAGEESPAVKIRYIDPSATIPREDVLFSETNAGDHFTGINRTKAEFIWDLRRKVPGQNFFIMSEQEGTVFIESVSVGSLLRKLNEMLIVNLAHLEYSLQLTDNPNAQERENVIWGTDEHVKEVKTYYFGQMKVDTSLVKTDEDLSKVLFKIFTALNEKILGDPKNEAIRETAEIAIRKLKQKVAAYLGVPVDAAMATKAKGKKIVRGTAKDAVNAVLQVFVKQYDAERALPIVTRPQVEFWAPKFLKYARMLESLGGEVDTKIKEIMGYPVIMPLKEAYDVKVSWKDPRNFIRVNPEGQNFTISAHGLFTYVHEVEDVLKHMSLSKMEFVKLIVALYGFSVSNEKIKGISSRDRAMVSTPTVLREAVDVANDHLNIAVAEYIQKKAQPRAQKATIQKLLDQVIKKASIVKSLGGKIAPEVKTIIGYDVKAFPVVQEVWIADDKNGEFTVDAFGGISEHVRVKADWKMFGKQAKLLRITLKEMVKFALAAKCNCSVDKNTKMGIRERDMAMMIRFRAPRPQLAGSLAKQLRSQRTDEDRDAMRRFLLESQVLYNPDQFSWTGNVKKFFELLGNELKAATPENIAWCKEFLSFKPQAQLAEFKNVSSYLSNKEFFKAAVVVAIRLQNKQNQKKEIKGIENANEFIRTWFLFQLQLADSVDSFAAGLEKVLSDNVFMSSEDGLALCQQLFKIIGKEDLADKLTIVSEIVQPTATRPALFTIASFDIVYGNRKLFSYKVDGIQRSEGEGRTIKTVVINFGSKVIASAEINGWNDPYMNKSVDMDGVKADIEKLNEDLSGTDEAMFFTPSEAALIKTLGLDKSAQDAVVFLTQQMILSRMDVMGMTREFLGKTLTADKFLSVTIAEYDNIPKLLAKFGQVILEKDWTANAVLQDKIDLIGSYQDPVKKKEVRFKLRVSASGFIQLLMYTFPRNDWKARTGLALGDEQYMIQGSSLQVEVSNLSVSNFTQVVFNKDKVITIKLRSREEGKYKWDLIINGKSINVNLGPNDFVSYGNGFLICSQMENKEEPFVVIRFDGNQMKKVPWEILKQKIDALPMRRISDLFNVRSAAFLINNGFGSARHIMHINWKELFDFLDANPDKWKVIGDAAMNAASDSKSALFENAIKGINGTNSKYKAEMSVKQGQVFLKFTEKGEPQKPETSITVIATKGFRVVSHIVNGKETLLMSEAPNEIGSGLFFMMPFVNRIQNGTVIRNGRMFELKPEEIQGLTRAVLDGRPTKNFMHGVGRGADTWKDFEVREQGGAIVVQASFETTDYPGLAEALGHSKTTVTYSFKGKELTIDVETQNLTTSAEAERDGGYEVIADFGVHPKRIFSPGETDIQVRGAQKVFEVSDELIPTGNLLALGNKNLNTPQILRGGTYDNTFLVKSQEGVITSITRDHKRGVITKVEMSGDMFVNKEGYGVFHVWDGSKEGGENFGIMGDESVTTTANGPNMQGQPGGSRLLKAGETRSGRVTITVDAAMLSIPASFLLKDGSGQLSERAKQYVRSQLQKRINSEEDAIKTRLKRFFYKVVSGITLNDNLIMYPIYQLLSSSCEDLYELEIAVQILADNMYVHEQKMGDKKIRTILKMDQVKHWISRYWEFRKILDMGKAIVEDRQERMQSIIKENKAHFSALRKQGMSEADILKEAEKMAVVVDMKYIYSVISKADFFEWETSISKILPEESRSGYELLRAVLYMLTSVEIFKEKVESFGLDKEVLRMIAEQIVWLKETTKLTKQFLKSRGNVYTIELNTVSSFAQAEENARLQARQDILKWLTKEKLAKGEAADDLSYRIRDLLVFAKKEGAFVFTVKYVDAKDQAMAVDNGDKKRNLQELKALRDMSRNVRKARKASELDVQEVFARRWLSANNALRQSALRMIEQKRQKLEARQAPGGIDLNGNKMGLDVAVEGKGVEFQFDPAMVAEFQRGDFTGVEAFIIKITPLASPLPLLGLDTTEPMEHKLAV